MPEPSRVTRLHQAADGQQRPTWASNDEPEPGLHCHLRRGTEADTAPGSGLDAVVEALEELQLLAPEARTLGSDRFLDDHFKVVFGLCSVRYCSKF